MFDKDPTHWEMETWFLALIMPIAGGVVHWIGQVKNKKTRPYNFVEFIGELFTSGFVGLGVFMLLQSLNQPIGVCAALSGISGHMATRLLFLIENLIENKIKNHLL